MLLESNLGSRISEGLTAGGRFSSVTVGPLIGFNDNTPSTLEFNNNTPSNGECSYHGKEEMEGNNANIIQDLTLGMGQMNIVRT